MVQRTNTELGKKGESIAVDFLVSKGFVILQTNWHFQHLEIDIIAKHNEFLVFVEVKTRTSGDFGHPEDAVSNQKIRRLTDAAEAYIFANDLDVEARFDVVSILLPSHAKPEIEYFEDAFLPLS